MHAVFAAKNEHHCAHLSFKPLADRDGKFKCQVSAQLSISSMFSDAELDTFAAFEAEVGFESGQHWRLSPCVTNADCPVAGDPEEDPAKSTGNYYESNTTCSTLAPTERRLLFGMMPQAGVCVSS
tara:strand:+ start:969 stop:1343 length:375 start_codon:yes stop_codon:yes gene_type:complete